MTRNHQKVSARGSIYVVLVILTAIILEDAIIKDERWYWCLFVTIPALVLAVPYKHSGFKNN